MSINKYSRLSDYNEDTFRLYGNVIESKCVVGFTEKHAEAKAKQISHPKYRFVSHLSRDKEIGSLHFFEFDILYLLKKAFNLTK